MRSRSDLVACWPLERSLEPRVHSMPESLLQWPHVVTTAEPRRGSSRMLWCSNFAGLDSKRQCGFHSELTLQLSAFLSAATTFAEAAAKPPRLWVLRPHGTPNEYCDLL